MFISSGILLITRKSKQRKIEGLELWRENDWEFLGHKKNNNVIPEKARQISL